MTDRNYIKEQEQVYEKQIKELKEQVKFFTNKSQRLDKENQQLEEKIKELNEELNHYKTENMRLITTNNTTYSYGVR